MKTKTSNHKSRVMFYIPLCASVSLVAFVAGFTAGDDQKIFPLLVTVSSLLLMVIVLFDIKFSKSKKPPSSIKYYSSIFR